MTPEKFFDHNNVVMFFSGGKDSVATLLSLRKSWGKFDVVWVNAGDASENTQRFMREVAQIVPRFSEVKSNVFAWISKNGWPVDVVPVLFTNLGASVTGNCATRYAPFLSCCSANIWDLMGEYIRNNNIHIAIYGQRKEDFIRNRGRDDTFSVIDGVAYWQPLHGATTSDVLNMIDWPLGYLSEHDCQHCTAYGWHKKSIPDKSADVLRELKTTLASEVDRLTAILEAHHG